MIKDNIYYKPKQSHFKDKSGRLNRLSDFAKFYDYLQPQLKPTSGVTFDKVKLKEYIEAHKKPLQPTIKKIIDSLIYVPYSVLVSNLNVNVKRFGDLQEKYIIVLCVEPEDIFKSNLYMTLLAWPMLKTKPYDILLDLDSATKMYGDIITNYLIIDDASYSGHQMTEINLYTKNKNVENNSKTTNKNMIVPVTDKNIDVHIILPYVSTIAYNLIKLRETATSFNIHLYTSKIIKTYGEILKPDEVTTMNTLYMGIDDYINFEDLVPLIFEHRIAGGLSTISLILQGGFVVDNPSKRIIFIEECKHLEKVKNVYNSPSCPKPPYKKFVFK